MKKLILLLVMVASAMLYSQHMDISGVVSEYDGAGKCVMCHPSGSSLDIEAIAREVAASAHFQFQVDVGNNQVYVWDGDNDLSNDVAVTGSYGKANRYCGLPGSVPAIAWLGLMQNPDAPFNAANPTYPQGLPGGCSRCHVGNGTLKISELKNDDAWKTVDCFTCHAETYQLNGKALNNYGARKAVSDSTTSTGLRLPMLAGNDLAVTSQSFVKKPTMNNCQSCHVWAGGGYTNKRGHDFDGNYGDNPIQDIHAGSLVCVDCHVTENHKIAMGRIKPACYLNEFNGHANQDKVACEFCHSSDGQAEYPDMNIPLAAHAGLPPKHLESVACQTCHIGNNLGLEAKYFDQIVREKDANGNFKRWKPRGKKYSGENTLLYKWYNGTVYDNVSPRGAHGDGKIHPFRANASYIPVDNATGIGIPVKLGLLFSADSTISNYTGMGVTAGDESALITKIIKKGAFDAMKALPDTYGALPHDAEGNYTGDYSWHWDNMLFSVDHGVMSKDNARSCVDCHAADGGILDWTSLGLTNPYIINDIDEESSIPTEYALAQNYPNPFNPTTTIAFSIKKRGYVSLKIYNTVGELVETLVNHEMAPGNFEVTFDAVNLASGVYIYQLTSGDFTASKKLMLMK